MMFRLHFTVFIFLLAMVSLGCNVSNKGAISNKGGHILFRKLDPVLLIPADLPTMQLQESDHRIGGDDPNIVLTLDQWWGKPLSVEYFLFDSASTARNAADNFSFRIVAAIPNSHRELNPNDVIGDATWRIIPKQLWEKHWTRIWFVKNNVLVDIRADGPPSQQLQFVRDVARKIEAKMEAVLQKK